MHTTPMAKHMFNSISDRGDLSFFQWNKVIATVAATAISDIEQPTNEMISNPNRCSLGIYSK